MAKEQLGAKRTCPETGKKFYDMNKDPVVSPYTGKSYPRSFFAEVQAAKPRKEAVAESETKVVAVEPEEEAVADAPEFVPLEEADGENADEAVDGEDIPEIPEVEVEVEDDAEEEPFLAEVEDDDESLSDVFEGGKNSEET